MVGEECVVINRFLFRLACLRGARTVALSLLPVPLLLVFASCKERDREAGTERGDSSAPHAPAETQANAVTAVVPRSQLIAIEPGEEWSLERFTDAAHLRLRRFLEGEARLPASGSWRELRPSLSEPAVAASTREEEPGPTSAETAPARIVEGVVVPNPRWRSARVTTESRR